MSLMLVREHPYFFAELPVFLSAILVARLVRNRDFSRMVFFSGLACMPEAFVGLTFGRYWHPGRFFGLTWGVEDLLFTFSSGAAVWILAAGWGLDRCDVGVRSFGVGVLRMLPLAITTLADLGLWMAGVDCMTANLLASLGLLLLLLIRKPELWRLSACGSAAYLISYVLQLQLAFHIWPSFLDCWNRNGPWGRLFLGVPLGEIGWAMVFGATWPVVLAYAFKVQFAARPAFADFALNGRSQLETASLISQASADAIGTE